MDIAAQIPPPASPHARGLASDSEPDLRPMQGEMLSTWIEIEMEAAMLRAAAEAGAVEARGALSSLLHADEVLALAAIEHAGAVQRQDAAAAVVGMNPAERAEIVRVQSRLNGVHLLPHMLDVVSLYRRAYIEQEAGRG